MVNLGTNRWSFKPEVGFSKALGPWTVELATAVTLYTDNDDFLEGGTRSQDPIYSTQAHLVYGFRSGVWASADATYFTGGRTTINLKRAVRACRGPFPACGRVPAGTEFRLGRGR